MKRSGFPSAIALLLALCLLLTAAPAVCAAEEEIPTGSTALQLLAATDETAEPVTLAYTPWGNRLGWYLSMEAVQAAIPEAAMAYSSCVKNGSLPPVYDLMWALNWTIEHYYQEPDYVNELGWADGVATEMLSEGDLNIVLLVDGAGCTVAYGKTVLTDTGAEITFHRSRMRLRPGGDPISLRRTQDEAAWQLYGMGLFRGVGRMADGTPDFALDRTLTRAEAVTMLVRLLGHEEDAAGAHPFTDVPDWASRYVGFAYEAGLTRGVSASRFDADTPVTGAQFATFLLRALGYESGVDFDWRAPWALARQIGLTEKAMDTAALSRRDATALAVAALKALRKDGTQTLAEQLIAQGCVSRFDAWKSGVYPAMGARMAREWDEAKAVTISLDRDVDSAWILRASEVAERLGLDSVCQIYYEYSVPEDRTEQEIWDDAFNRLLSNRAQGTTQSTPDAVFWTEAAEYSVLMLAVDETDTICAAARYDSALSADTARVIPLQIPTDAALMTEIHDTIYRLEEALPCLPITHTTIFKEGQEAFVAFGNLPEEAVFARRITFPPAMLDRETLTSQAWDRGQIQRILFESACDWRALDRVDGMSNESVPLGPAGTQGVSYFLFFDADRRPIGYSIYKFSP